MAYCSKTENCFEKNNKSTPLQAFNFRIIISLVVKFTVTFETSNTRTNIWYTTCLCMGFWQHRVFLQRNRLFQSCSSKLIGFGDPFLWGNINYNFFYKNVGLCFGYFHIPTLEHSPYMCYFHTKCLNIIALKITETTYEKLSPFSHLYRGGISKAVK